MVGVGEGIVVGVGVDRKSTRLNSSHGSISYAVFCLKKNSRVNSATRFVGFVVAPSAAFGAGIVDDLIGLRPTLSAAAIIDSLSFHYLLVSPFRRYPH